METIPDIEPVDAKTIPGFEHTKESIVKEKVLKRDPITDMLKKNGASPLEGYPDDVTGYLREYIRLSNHRPIKSEKSDWIKTARTWREMGVKPKEVSDMYRYALANWDIARPGSITNAYRMMKSQRNTDDELEQENQRLKELHG